MKLNSSPRKHGRERIMSRSGSVPNLSSNQSSTHQLSASPVQSRNASKHGKDQINLKGRLANRPHLDALHLNRLGTSFDETGPYIQYANSIINSNVSPVTRGKDYLQTMINVHAKKERNKMSDTAKRHILSRQKKVDNYEHQSVNFKAIKNRR